MSDKPGIFGFRNGIWCDGNVHFNSQPGLVFFFPPTKCDVFYDLMHPHKACTETIRRYQTHNNRVAPRWRSMSPASDVFCLNSVRKVPVFSENFSDSSGSGTTCDRGTPFVAFRPSTLINNVRMFILSSSPRRLQQQLKKKEGNLYFLLKTSTQQHEGSTLTRDPAGIAAPAISRDQRTTEITSANEGRAASRC